MFFLQFAVITKRYRNYLDWAIANRPESPAARCPLARTESKGTEEWYPCYWREWDMQRAQWVAPFDFGCLFMFDWEN